MGIASQDYRDGASTATHELRRRLISGLDWGYALTRESIDKVAEELCKEYGGRVPVADVIADMAHVGKAYVPPTLKSGNESAARYPA